MSQRTGFTPRILLRCIRATTLPVATRLTKLLPCEVAMYWDVKTVKPLNDYRIYIEIEDGRHGVFDLKPYLDHGVFRELRDVHYFNQVGMLFGAATWPHEQDIAPETLLAELAQIELVD